MRTFSVALGVYAVFAILFAASTLYAARDTGKLDEDVLAVRQAEFARVALFLAISAPVAGYGSYRVWNLASGIWRSNFRRAKQRD